MIWHHKWIIALVGTESRIKKGGLREIFPHPLMKNLSTPQHSLGQKHNRVNCPGTKFKELIRREVNLYDIGHRDIYYSTRALFIFQSKSFFLLRPRQHLHWYFWKIILFTPFSLPFMRKYHFGHTERADFWKRLIVVFAWKNEKGGFRMQWCWHASLNAGSVRDAIACASF